MKTTAEWVERFQKDEVKIDICNTPAEIWPDNSGLYYWDSDLIEMIPNTDLGTLFHELSHWTGNRKRLDRALNHTVTNVGWDYEELIAWGSTKILTTKVGFKLDEDDEGLFQRFKIKHPTYDFHEEALAASSYLIHRFGL